MQNKLKSKTTKVSIVCITYNQEKFIRQALTSFMNQKTDFDFEVIIADDASTDNTVNIIEEFQKKYPKIINPIFRKENIGIVKNLVDAIKQAKGEYIALCEGDDFFTDKNKLQTQADFLDKHSDYTLCFHLVRVFFENKEEKDFIFPQLNPKAKLDLEELLTRNFIQTNSVMYRRQNYNELTEAKILPYDWYMHLYHARFGKLGFIDKVMSSYRKHEGGVWWNSYKDMNQLVQEFSNEHMALFFQLIKLYGENNDYREIILNNIDKLFDKLIVVDQEHKNFDLTEKLIKEFPKEIALYLTSRRQKVIKLEEDLTLTKAQLDILNKEHDRVINSRQWKTVSKMYPLIPKIVKKNIILLVQTKRKVTKKKKHK